MKFNIPKEIIGIGKELENAGFEAYLVGGCVRDLLLKKEPKDWDITTDAKPEQIQKIFLDSVYENKFGTVGVKTESEDPKLKVVEITTYRIEGKYTDKRHPDEIKFAKTIEEDLSRRDFTINAIALRILNSQSSILNPNLIDPYKGQDDLKNKTIRTVGNPEQRFNEDALRLVRAVRFAAELGFEIEKETETAIKNEAGLLEMIAKERIRDEFIKLIMTSNAKEGIEKSEELNLLKYILPELREGIGVTQNKHHIYSVWEHNLRALDYAVSKNYPLEIRLASLLHDVGKVRTKAGEGQDATFYAHEIVGAEMAAKIMDHLRFPNSIAEKVIHLVRYHLFYYNVGEVTEAGVRRFLKRVGPEYVDDLIKIREADRIGSGVPKAVPYKLRHLLFMIDKVKRDPISPKMLKINGTDVMEILNVKPGPRIGWLISIVLEEVLDEPSKNKIDFLKSRINELNKLTDKELEKMSKEARETKEEFESGAVEEIKKKHRV
ncbi:HDIG domain-containing protein [Candidatus Wolfebacteria bacterium]|nr:HDIG domain-containing protein [Candidatus Wolfebacteria bacterium]